MPYRLTLKSNINLLALMSTLIPWHCVIYLSHIRFPHPISSDYKDAIISIIVKHKIKLMLVLSDDEALVLGEPSIRQEINSLGCEVLLPHYDVIQRCVDKGQFMSFLQQDTLTSTPYFLIHNFDEFLEASTLLGYPKNKFIVKPTRGCGSRGVMIIDSEASISELLLTRNYRRFTLQFAQNIFDVEQDLELLAMPLYEGNDYNIDVLCQNGRVIYSMVQLRLSPMMGAIMTAKVVHESDIDSLVEHLVSRFNITGLVNIEVARCSTTCRPHVYELNPRPSAAFAFMSYQAVDILGDLHSCFNLRHIQHKHFEPMIIKRVWEQIYCD